MVVTVTNENIHESDLLYKSFGKGAPGLGKRRCFFDDLHHQLNPLSRAERMSRTLGGRHTPQEAQGRPRLMLLGSN